ncbi:DUF1565 domain-containing protein [Nostoc sp. UHCC 0302]|uniref:DUF1565 domain-containing protein n=1 Tax=Nostoc sp. UHCC 0302 TaxID=3134896 RepID=UPI00311CD571
MVSPLVIFNYLRVDVLLAKLNFLESVMLWVSRSSVLSFTLGIGVASVALLSTSFSSATAQLPDAPNQMPLGEKTISQVNALFVNPSVGDDNTGNGSDRAPLKTITQALRRANANTVIMLSPGNYTAETGEVFPLILKPSVSIQGNPSNKGKDITIQGGGGYLSRSFGGQNVTIVGAKQAGLTGVTVTNSNPRGYGLWIESSNPVVQENTFTGSTQDGISVNGDAAPTISKNYFYRNGANGITITGNSRAEVRENIFQQTGFGINIAQNAAPVIVGNQIQQNRSGIIVQANARPILRNNIIQTSKEDGLVAIAKAMPDLGSASEPGGNEFRDNARYDINASAAKQVISAPGNNFAINRINGKVDINGSTAQVAQNSQPASVSNGTLQEIAPNEEITFSASEISPTTNKRPLPLPSNSISQNNTAAPLNANLLPLVPANVRNSVPQSNQPQPTPRVAGFPVPRSLATRQTQATAQANITPQPANSSDMPQLNYVRIDPNTIEFTAPQPPANVAQTQVSTRGEQGQSLPILETPPPNNSEQQVEREINPPSTASLLPVPDRNLPNVPVPESSTTVAYSRDLPPVSTKQLGIRYRVVVPLVSDRDQDLVRSLAPGAFSTVWEGQRVMQAGVFSSEYNATQMLRTLTSKGLRAIMEPLN